MAPAIQDTVNKAVNRYGNFTLRLGQMHKLILTDTQKTEYLDITDLHADPDEDYLCFCGSLMMMTNNFKKYLLIQKQFIIYINIYIYYG